MKDIGEFNPDTPAWNATWHLRIWIDPEHLLLVRRDQMMQLGRYGHQQVTQWWDVELNEFRGWYESLDRILKGENPLQSEMETNS